MKSLLKFMALLILTMPICFLTSCSDDDDDDNNNGVEEKLYLRELYDNTGDIMIYDYDSKNRVSNVTLYDDGMYRFVNLEYNPLKIKTYSKPGINTDIDEETLYNSDELALFSSIKTNKAGNITSCVINTKSGIVKLKAEYDSDQHPLKFTHAYVGEDWSSTDVAELSWVNGNLVHYTVTDEDGMYFESFLEYENTESLTGQPTYALILAYWNEPEFISGVLGKLSKNLPSKLTTKYYEQGELPETNIYNISYSFGDNGEVVEEYLENNENPFWVKHIGKYVRRYEVYHGYTK